MWSYIPAFFLSPVNDPLSLDIIKMNRRIIPVADHKKRLPAEVFFQPSKDKVLQKVEMYYPDTNQHRAFVLRYLKNTFWNCFYIHCFIALKAKEQTNLKMTPTDAARDFFTTYKITEEHIRMDSAMRKWRRVYHKYKENNRIPFLM